jgi:hypothetical protein
MLLDVGLICSAIFRVQARDTGDQVHLDISKCPFANHFVVARVKNAGVKKHLAVTISAAMLDLVT